MKKIIFIGRSFAKAKLQATSLWLVAVIIAMAFTACNRGSGTSGTQSQTTTAEKTQTAVTLTADPYDPNGLYAKILSGDFSAFAGRWVNDHGGGWVDLTKDGLLQDIGYSVSNIKKIGDAYSWDLSTGVVSMPVFLFPAGTEITDEDNQRVQTDTTKDRIAIDRCYSNQVYYRQGEAASQSKVWEPAELTGEWHSRSITGSCHGQEHYIFTADGYYRKGDLYQKHDGTWTLVRDAATGKYHLTLQYKQFIDFESGWSPNEFTAYSSMKQ